MKLHKTSKIRGGKLVVLLAVGIALSLFSVRAAELVLNDIQTVAAGYTTYSSGTLISGTGGYRIKDGGVLRFNENATFANTFSGGIDRKSVV